ncbi:MAG: HAD family hydrolase [Candidatus Hodarchaeales archaeon]|jgi:phosphoglycolate phosphatase-like HAD superfamily hydrolase
MIKLLQKPRLIIFDYDMTLADTLPFFEGAIAEQIQVKLSSEEIHAIAVNKVYSRIDESTHNIKWHLVKMFYAVARESGCNPITAFWKTWKSGRHTSKEYSSVKPVEGALETVQYLKTRDIKLTILSMSSRKKVTSFLENHNLQDSFDLVVTKEMFKGTKTVRLSGICDNFGFFPGDCLMVGDLPGDITSAKEAGFKSVGVMTGAASRQLLESLHPDLILSSVKDLPAQVK